MGCQAVWAGGCVQTAQEWFKRLIPRLGIAWLSARVENGGSKGSKDCKEGLRKISLECLEKPAFLEI